MEDKFSFQHLLTTQNIQQVPRRPVQLAILICLLALWLTIPSQAQTVIAGTALSGAPDRIGFLPLGAGEDFAESFQVVPGGPWMVQQLQVLVFFDPSNPSVDATFYILEDAFDNDRVPPQPGDGPGRVLTSFTVTLSPNPRDPDTGRLVPQIITAQPSTPVSLNPGTTYWLLGQAQNFFVGWINTDDGSTGSIEQGCLGCSYTNPQILPLLAFQLAGVPLVTACKVDDLSPIAQDASEFEASAPNAPHSSLIPDEVNSSLSAQGTLLESSTGRVRTSGFRPFNYQKHLRELRDRLADYQRTVKLDPNQITACADLKKKIDDEIDRKHAIPRDASGLPRVNNPKSSFHTDLPANALDFNTKNLSPAALASVDAAAKRFNLYRPCKNDVVHYTLRGTGCQSAAMTFMVQSPLNILISDPLGRRAGYDAASNSILSEIPDAYYSGPETEPQFVDIEDPIPGQYTLTAVGFGNGPYTLTIDDEDEDGTSIQTQEISGNIVAGQVVKMTQLASATVAISTDPVEAKDLLGSNSGEHVNVIILKANGFDPNKVDRETLHFGSTGSENSLMGCEERDQDANAQGLVCHFRLRSAHLDETGFVILTGKLKDGTPIRGTDVLVTKVDH